MIYSLYRVAATLCPRQTEGAGAAEVRAGATLVMKGRANLVRHCHLGKLQSMNTHQTSKHHQHLVVFWILIWRENISKLQPPNDSQLPVGYRAVHPYQHELMLLNLSLWEWMMCKWQADWVWGQFWSSGSISAALMLVMTWCYPALYSWHLSALFPLLSSFRSSVTWELVWSDASFCRLFFLVSWILSSGWGCCHLLIWSS